MSHTAKLYIGGAIFFLVVGLFLLKLAPILMPFAVGAGIAYLCNPLVDKLVKLGLKRTLAVIIIFVLVGVAFSLLLLVLIPLVQRQVALLISSLPSYFDWANTEVRPLLEDAFGIAPTFDFDSIKQVLGQHWRTASDFAAMTLKQLFASGTSLLGWLTNLLLTPLILFYLLRDWPRMLRWIQNQLPRRYEPKISALVTEIDASLGQFIRGQLSVMAILSAVYVAGLWLLDLNLALVIGVVAGIVSFVPYLGLVTGIVLASIAVLVQTGDAWLLLWVVLLFGLSQVLETAILQPLLVGDAIGLHPVWVIFVVLAGGQLFGFIGVLLALPVGAAIAVLLRSGAASWRESPAYLESL